MMGRTFGAERLKIRLGRIGLQQRLVKIFRQFFGSKRLFHTVILS